MDKKEIEQSIEYVFSKSNPELSESEIHLLEHSFGKLDIVYNDEIFIATIITDRSKISTGFKGLINFYVTSGAGVQLFYTTYNGKPLNAEEKGNFYKEFIPKEYYEKAMVNLQKEYEKHFSNED